MLIVNAWAQCEVIYKWRKAQQRARLERNTVNSSLCLALLGSLGEKDIPQFETSNYVESACEQNKSRQVFPMSGEAAEVVTRNCVHTHKHTWMHTHTCTCAHMHIHFFFSHVHQSFIACGTLVSGILKLDGHGVIFQGNAQYTMDWICAFRVLSL